jgi:hypothetical protein
VGNGIALYVADHEAEWSVRVTAEIVHW